MQFVAFLRGMNVGGRRITNDDLCDSLRVAGFQDVWAFFASGNVVLESPSASAAKTTRLIEAGLEGALGYAVPTFLRTVKEVTRIAATSPFAESAGSDGGKLQVSLLAKKPTAPQRKKALTLATANDQLAIDGQELFWLPEGKLTDSVLDMAVLDKAIGPMTTRTQRTIQRLASKLAAT